MVALLIPVLLLTVQLVTGLRFPIIGDWGDNLPSGVANQKRVADQLASWCASNTCEFIFSMGDNFYPQGVTSPTDPRFDSSWKNVYNQPTLANKVWYQSIGNHDHDSRLPSDGREWNQVLYGNSEPRWYFPDRWYDFVVQDPAGFSVHFVTIDTMSLRWGINDPEGQLQWLDDTLAASTSEWRVVVAHHPPYSAGNHGPTDPDIDALVVPICKRHKVQLLLSGHDHNLQHIQNATNVNEIDYVISGGGGRGLYQFSNLNANILINRGFVITYFGYFYGFTDLEFTADRVYIQHIDVDGNVVHTFNRGLSTEPRRVA